MSETEVKMALERIHNNNYRTEEKMGIVKKIKDNYIQGIQLNVCYTSHWDNIKEIFKKNGLTLSKYGPILTINEWHNVIEIDKIPHNDGIEFITMLHTFPIWCRKNHMKEFIEWYNKNKEKLLSTRKTILEIDEQIKEVIEE